MTYTPESYDRRVQAWANVDADADTIVYGNWQPPRTEEELRQRRIGDAERIAITLLTQNSEGVRYVHPWVYAWIQRLCTDTGYADYLSAVEDDPSSIDAEPTEPGYLTSGLEAAIWAGRPLWTGTDENEEPDDALSPRDLARRRGHQTFHRLGRRAHLHLAYALVMHRLYGEPDQDRSSTIGGIATITTSLAAAICEYHSSIVEATASAAVEEELAGA